jgi:glycosyltransferase involved in cell wall biosynthesis
MPLYHDLNEIARGATFPEMEDAAPLVFWDGYGLSHRGSGIFIHASQLGRALIGEGVSPILMGNEGIHKNFPEFDVIGVKQGAFSKLSESKLVRPTKSFQHLKNLSKPFIYHGLSNINLPLIGRNPHARFVVTIHDVIPLLAPKSVSKKYFLQFRAALKNVCSRADAIICVSQWTAKTLQAHTSVDPGKIHVIMNGRPKVQIKVAREPSNSIKLISVGRFEPYKNFDRLIQLVRQMKQLSLTLVTDRSGKAQFEEFGKDLIEDQRLQVFTHQTPEQLVSHYCAADVYVHMSQFEGFCLPAVEAMATALPVVYRLGSGIDEVCGHDVCRPLGEFATADDWMEAIATMAEDSKSAEFPERLEQHLSKLDDWGQAAKKVKNLYESLLARP